jgi:IclR family acetate operon transcriptional repressor
MSNYQNRILPPYASSLGKAISAWQTPERLQLLVQVYGIYRTTDRTITEPVLIREEMARIRECGFAREYEETVRGGCCFAVPVQLENEPVRAAISVSMPVARLTPEREELIPDLLVKAALRVAKKLERISHLKRAYFSFFRAPSSMLCLRGSRSVGPPTGPVQITSAFTTPRPL